MNTKEIKYTGSIEDFHEIWDNFIKADSELNSLSCTSTNIVQWTKLDYFDDIVVTNSMEEFINE